jgi:biotin transport system substrate-specific component
MPRSKTGSPPLCHQERRMRIAQTQVLADRVIPGEGLLLDAARIAAANLLLVLCAWLAVPLPWTPVPITGQTFGVLLVAVLLGSRRATIVLGLYLLEGLSGLPVFQPFGLPGAARLAGPTAGYLLAYPVAAYATGWLVERGAGDSVVRLTGALLAGEFVIFAGGCGWLAAGMRFGWTRAIAAGLTPFLASEGLKMALVVAAVRGAQRIRKRA